MFLLGSGQVKVLDFGLARMDPVAPEGTDVPTVSLSTEPGRVMGTVGYMAPEQVRGKAVDARADIFSFGAVLYEMLTGKRAFRGESPVETLNAILKEDPPSLFESTRNVSPALERIVRRCLEKRPEERFRTAHDLAIALDAISTSSTRSLTAEALEASGERPAGAGRGRLLERLSLVLAGAALAGGAMLAWERARPPEANGAAVFRWMSFSGRDSSPAVSPDGRTVAFTSDRDGQPRIWLKQVSGEGEAPLTTGPDDFPRFSPDGTQILFARPDGAGTSLYRAAVLGGEARRLLEGATEGDWSPDGKQDRLPAPAERGRPDGDRGRAWRRRTAPSRARWRRCRAGCARPAGRPTGATIAVVPAPGALLAGAQQGVVLVGVEDGAGAGRARARPAPQHLGRGVDRGRARSSTCRPSRWSARRGARPSSCGRTRRAAASSRRRGARRARSSSTCSATGASCSTRGRPARTCAR